MRRHALWLAAIVLALSAPASGATPTYFGFNIGVTNAPPPPMMVYDEPPPVVLVPRTRVYVIEDDDRDFFRYGGMWYAYNDGYWYRARSYRGPFAVVDVRRVPNQIFYVPASHWHHHPPGLAKKQSGKGHGHGKHGHGHGHGHGHD